MHISAMNSDRIQRVANSVANERSLDTALDRIVRGLAAEEEVALARIWLIETGDICDACPMREECPDQTRCLHLVASDGASLAEVGTRWTSLAGGALYGAGGAGDCEWEDRGQRRGGGPTRGAPIDAHVETRHAGDLEASQRGGR